MIQLQFLNKILESKDSTLITLNNLTDEFFSDYKDEFNFIKNHLQRYNTIPDKVTFLNTFPDFDITKVQETDKYLLDAIYEDRNKRLLARTFNKVREALNNGDTEEAMKIYSSASEQMAKAKHIEAVNIFQDQDRYDEYVEKSTDFSKYYVTTGFEELDSVLGGWDRKNEYAVIMARPGVGKSWLALKTAVAAVEQGLKVGLYSGEMHKNKVGYRLDTLISHISNFKISKGIANVQVEYKKYLDTINENLKGELLVLTPDMVGGNGSVGVGILRAFIEKYKLDMLVVDQHSLLEDDRGAKNPVDRAANISKDIKKLQVLTGIPIITVSQQNREDTQEKGVSTKNVAASDRLGQDASILIAIEKKNDTMTLHIIKSRDGGDGNSLNYYVDLDKGVFKFIPNEEDATKGAGCEELKNEFEDDGEKPF